MENKCLWKIRKRSGAVKRRIKKEYLAITNYEVSSVIKNQVPSTSNTVGSVADISITDGNDLNTSINRVGYANSVEPFFDSASDISSCSSESTAEGHNDEISKNILFREEIKKWAIERNITQAALNELANILNRRFPQILPKDSRTILRTVKQIQTKNIEKGEYWHNGLTESLKEEVENWIDVPSNVLLNFNFDGLPIFKSSNKEFWPILCTIFERPEIEPFVIGIYFGVGKPKNIDEYIEDFVNEMEHLTQTGIYLERLNKTVAIKIRCFICDSPARAYIKGVCNFNAKHGCLKCVTVGEYSHVSHTVFFPSSNCLPRTDEDFRRKKYGPHHKKDSPILRLPVDIIKDFPVADSLHLVDLGIMKRLLVGWRNGNFDKYITKWRAKDIELVTDFLIKRKLPSEIHRSVRGLDCISHWKASEYRSFLFYLSIIILPDVLPQDAFVHFLTFYCGITICSSDNYSHLLHLASKLLQYFVEHFKDFYGVDYVTSNIHNLLHITEEVHRFGPLYTFSAYPFENKLYLIKRMLRHGNKPLAQIAKRFSEDSAYKVKKSNSRCGSNKKITHDPNTFVTTNNRNITVLHFKNFKISTKTKDKYVMCRNNFILEVREIIIDDREIKIKGYKITELQEVFEKPVKSSILNIYKAELHASRLSETIVSAQDIKLKLACTEHKTQLYFIPLLHTL